MCTKKWTASLLAVLLVTALVIHHRPYNYSKLPLAEFNSTETLKRKHLHIRL